jgi:hypothetical protein
MEKKIIILVVIVIIAFIVFFLGILSTRNEKYNNNLRKNNYDVDVVYTWVESVDEEREKYKQLLGLQEKDGNLNPNRYIDNQELKYSLRGIDMHMPWVRNVIIVVKDGQKPNYLNFENPKIRLVRHSEFIPKKYLPVFNSITIEHFLYRIPNLSERYIYFNDDIMVIKNMEKENFFSADGKPKINFHKDNNPTFSKFQNVYSHEQTRTYNNQLAKKIFRVHFALKQPHTPSPSFIPWDKELDELLQSQSFFNMTKFRENKNLMKNNLLQTFFYYTKGAETVQWNEAYIEYNKSSMVDVVNYSTIFNPDTMFLCVNAVSEENKHEYEELMMMCLFPRKSQYEF